MKKVLLSLCIAGIAFSSHAQFTSPDIGVNWDLDSLVAFSNGAIVQNGDEYHFLEDFILSENDTLEITTNGIIKVDAEAAIELLGTALFIPDDSLIITAMDSTAFFPSIRIENSGTIISKTTISYGGGIGIYDASPHITHSTFMFNQEELKGAINLFRSNAIIENCNFYDNYSSAISGGANIANAPQILNCVFLRNVTSNTNRSQISFGTTGTDTVIIKGNHIEGLHEMAGGISFLPLGEAFTVIDSNIIENNRYGIGLLMGGIHSVITNNIIKNNDIQDDPMLGGSGINFSGDTTNVSIVSNNEIFGNLWGVTIQMNARPNIGDLRTESYNEGMNKIYENFNSSNGSMEEFAIFNNTPDSIWAQNNDWGDLDSMGIEDIIFHENDDNTLGFVVYLPKYEPTGISDVNTPISDLTIYPNPASNQITINASLITKETAMEIYDISGRKILEFQVLSNEHKTVDISALNSGMYLLRWKEGSVSHIQKLTVNK